MFLDSSVTYVPGPYPGCHLTPGPCSCEAGLDCPFGSSTYVLH